MASQLLEGAGVRTDGYLTGKRARKITHTLYADMTIAFVFATLFKCNSMSVNMDLNTYV